MSASQEAAEQQSIPLEGRLGDPAVLPRLFAWLARGDWSGMVLIRAGDVERRVYFVEGRVGTAGSSDPGESLAQALIREGLLTEEERSRAAGQLRVTDRGWMFGRQLVRAGLLQEKDLARVERRRVVQLVEATLSLRTGTYACESGTVAGDAQPQQALEVPRLVAEGVLTYWDANSALEALGGRDAVVDLVMEHLPEHEATGAEEAYDYTLLLCDGRRSVADILERAPLPEAASLRFLAALRLLGIVSTRPQPVVAPQPVAARPEPAAGSLGGGTVDAAAPGGASLVAEGASASAVKQDLASPPTPHAGGSGEAAAPVEMPSRLKAAGKPDAAPAPGEARASDAAARGPAAKPAAPAPRAPSSRTPAAAAGAGEPSKSSRTGWMFVVMVILLLATAFFAWIGWREFSRPATTPTDLGTLGSSEAMPAGPAGAEPFATPSEIAPSAPVEQPLPDGSATDESPAASPAGAAGTGIAPLTGSDPAATAAPPAPETPSPAPAPAGGQP